MGPIFTIVSSVTVLIELLKSVLTHLLHCVQHSPQDSVIKIKSVQQPTDSERGDLIPSTLPPDAQIYSPALSLTPALWPPFRNLNQLTKLTISVLPVKPGKEQSILAAQSQNHGRQGYIY